MAITWKGIYPALTTQFTKEDKLDFPLFEKNLRAQIDAGIDGIILGGTLGESSVLTTGEKEKLVKFAIEKVAGKIPVILNIAEGCTREALEQVEFAKNWGAEGLMALPPMRYKSDHRETVQWFTTIANATDLPIIVYNNPVDYKTLITLEMFDELNDCKNIEAVKESTRDVTNVTRMRNRFADRYKILMWGGYTGNGGTLSWCRWMGSRIGMCISKRNGCYLSFGESRKNRRSSKNLSLVYAFA